MSEYRIGCHVNVSIWGIYIVQLNPHHCPAAAAVPINAFLYFLQVNKFVVTLSDFIEIYFKDWPP